MLGWKRDVLRVIVQVFLLLGSRPYLYTSSRLHLPNHLQTQRQSKQGTHACTRKCDARLTHKHPPGDETEQ